MLRDLIDDVATAALPDLLAAIDAHLSASVRAFAAGTYCLAPDGRPWASLVTGLPKAFHDAYETAGRPTDPVHEHVTATLLPASDSSALSEEGWRRSALFTRVSRPFGLSHILQAPVLDARGVMVGSIHAARALGDDPFDDRDLTVAAGLAGWLAARLPRAPEPDPVTTAPLVLTPRQQQVATMVGQGRTNRQVATALGVTEHAVKQLLKRVYRQHGLTGRAQLAAAWASHGSSPDPGAQLA